jgi:hypothetical protein
MDSSGSGQGPVAGCCEHCNATLASTQGGDLLSRQLVARKDPAQLKD